MKKKLLRIFLFLIALIGLIVPSESNPPKRVEAAVNHTGGYVYFLKPSTWTESTVMMFIGHDSYTSVYTMTKVSNTNNFYRYTMPSWGGATYVAFANASSAWGSGDWGPSNRTNAPHYTNVYNNYGFNSGSYYVCVPSGTSNNTNITINYMGTTAGTINLTTEAHVINMATSATDQNAGTIQVSGYYMSSYSTCSVRNPVSNTKKVSTKLTPGTTVTFEVAQVNSGYKFVGWSTSNSSTNIVSTENKYTYNYDITYTGKTMYALFAPQYTITLVPGANASVSQSTFNVFYKDNYPTLPDPTHSDPTTNTFMGWFTASSGGTKVTSSTIYTTAGNTTLYAQWKQLANCTVTFVSNGQTLNTITVYEEQPYSFRNNEAAFNPPDRPGYTFLGWFNSSDQRITAESIVSQNPTAHTLTAKWEIIEYTITYDGVDDSNNNTVNAKNTFTIEDETFTIVAPTKEYYTFLGWTGSNGQEPENEITIENGSTENRTYTANWENKVTIYLDFSGIKDWYGNDASKAYYPFIYFWNSSTNQNIGWNYDDTNKKSNDYTRFTDIGNNLYKYEINFLDAELANLQEIDKFIVGFYYDFDNNPDSHQNPLQTTNISFPISYRDNGKEFRFIYNSITQSSWTNESKLNNFSLGQVVTVKYIDTTRGAIRTEDPIKTRDPVYRNYPYLEEKEGYKLEGWYTDKDHIGEEEYLFTHNYEFNSSTPGDFKVYANYVEMNDFYIYVEAKDLGWNLETMSVYKWNSYFNGDTHNNGAWPGNRDDLSYIGNGIYRVYIDVSKSYDRLVFCDESTPNITQYENTDYIVQTEDIILTPDMSYYIISNEAYYNEDTDEGRKKGQVGRHLNPIIYEKTLDNFIVAQKNTSSDVNAFRFTSELIEYDDNVTEKNKEFGFKFIFIKNDVADSYVGYWNFEKSSMMDCIRYDGVLYEASKEQCKGYYSLQLTDDITFKYKDYNQIIVVACYRTDSNKTQIIKAQEFNVTMIDGTIYLYEIER